MNTRKLGCIRDKEDRRDYLFAAHAKCRVENLPETFDMRDKMPPVYDQGQLGSCTGNATAGACHYIDGITFGFHDPPSRLYAYYRAREIEGSVPQDAGAQIRDVVIGVAQNGIPHESIWPYDPARFANTPSAAADADAEKHQAIRYHRVNQNVVGEIKAAVLNLSPVILGIQCFSSIMSTYAAQTGNVSMPRSGEQSQGGHAVLIVGWTAHGWIVRNSWGPGWGAKGYFYLPFEYVQKYGLDAWAIEAMEDPTVDNVTAK